MKGFLNSPRQHRSYTYFVCFLIVGTLDASLGPALLPLASNTQVSLEQIGILFSAKWAGTLVAILTMGTLFDRGWGHRLLSGLLLLGAGALILIPSLGWLPVLAVVIALLGLTEGSVKLGGNLLMVWNEPERSGSRLSLLNFCFGCGAIAAPLLVSGIWKQSGQLHGAYYVMATGLALVGVLFLFIPPPRPEAESQPDHAMDRQHWKVVSGVTLFLFMYVGIEVVIGGWLPTYLVQSQLTSEIMAGWITAAFWGAFTLGRLIAAIQPIWSGFRLIQSGLIGAGLSATIWLMFPHSLIVVWGIAVGMGLSLAPLFPMTLAFLKEHVPLSGKLTSLIFTGICIGAMSFPWSVGQVIAWGGPHTFVWSVWGLVVTAGLVFWLGVNRYQVRATGMLQRLT